MEEREMRGCAGGGGGAGGGSGGGQQCGCVRTTEYMGDKITSVSGAGV